MSAIMSFINGFFAALYDLGAWLLDGLLYVLTAFLFVPFDAILTITEHAISGISFAAITFNGAAAWAELPPQFIWLLNAVGFPTGLTMIVSAIGIRMALNLIPASLTRV